MKHSVRGLLTGALASALLGLSPFAVSPARAVSFSQIELNSSTLQVIHNTPANSDVLNMSLNVTNIGNYGSCENGADDLLESGVEVSVFNGSCLEYFFSCIFSDFGCPSFTFDAVLYPFVEHDIGNTSYGTFFVPNGAGSVSAKIATAPAPEWIYDTCGTWKITMQATKLNLSSITANPIALFLNDSDNDGAGESTSGPACFNVNAQIGNGIPKPMHRARH